MTDWAIYIICGVAVLAMLGRPAIMVFFPGSPFACWLEDNIPERFDSCSDGDGGDGGDGGD